MFGIGLPELIVIMAVALIVVGPDKLPDLARSVAKTLMDLKKTAEDFKDSFNEEIDNPLSDIKPQLEDAARKFRETVIDQEGDVIVDEATRKQRQKNLDTPYEAPSSEEREEVGLLSPVEASPEENNEAADPEESGDSDETDESSSDNTSSKNA